VDGISPSFVLLFEMKTIFLVALGFLCVQSCFSQEAGWKLAWSDEFNYEGLPDSAKWNFETKGNATGWGNNEKQWYTAGRLSNARVSGGRLKITARREQEGGRAFTSARLSTAGKAEFRYGKIEARIKLPSGRGLWPAFWMLAKNRTTTRWPDCGEIDIMEHVGYEKDSVHGTIHSGAYNHVKGTQKGRAVFIRRPYARFHRYAIEWTPEKIDFLLDGRVYYSFSNEHKSAREWPFDQPFYLILNLAVGGNWGGKMGIDESVLPAAMEVDYVRVYQKVQDTADLPRTLKVMTYNIRLDLKSDGVNAWDQRRDFLAAQIGFYEPDVFGVQEARPNQVLDLAAALPGYSYAGVGRDGNNTGEASDIFFKKDRFSLLGSGTFWLSQTPDTVSRGWDAAYNRICTYALLLDRKTRRKFWFFNTHLDNEGVIARQKGMELIFSRMEALNAAGLPVIFSGDLNSEPGDPLIGYIKQHMTDTRSISRQEPFGPAGTFNGFRHDQPVVQLIDYIFVSPGDFEVLKHAVLSDSRDLRYPSDHLPVYAELEFR
jgi:beta-glucanase (GH16 family)